MVHHITTRGSKMLQIPAESEKSEWPRSLLRAENLLHRVHRGHRGKSGPHAGSELIEWKGRERHGIR